MANITQAAIVAFWSSGYVEPSSGPCLAGPIQFAGDKQSALCGAILPVNLSPQFLDRMVGHSSPNAPVDGSQRLSSLLLPVPPSVAETFNVVDDIVVYSQAIEAAPEVYARATSRGRARMGRTPARCKGKARGPARHRR
jgi:hypothetical protein